MLAGRLFFLGGNLGLVCSGQLDRHDGITVCRNMSETNKLVDFCCLLAMVLSSMRG